MNIEDCNASVDWSMLERPIDETGMVFFPFHFHFSLYIPLCLFVYVV